MGETGHTALPVVSRANARHIVGIVTLADILAVYGVERRSRSVKGREETRASA
jgi:CBS domain-containing protein